MDSLFVYSVIHSIIPQASSWVTGLIVTLVMALIGYVINGVKHRITQPKKDLALIKGTAAITAETINQQIHDRSRTLKKDDKNQTIVENFNLDVKDESKPAITSKMDKAVQKAGGVLTVVNNILPILKTVLPMFRK